MDRCHFSNIKPTEEDAANETELRGNKMGAMTVATRLITFIEVLSKAGKASSRPFINGKFFVYDR